jgi:hypothetical protein
MWNADTWKNNSCSLKSNKYHKLLVLTNLDKEEYTSQPSDSKGSMLAGSYMTPVEYKDGICM